MDCKLIEGRIAVNVADLIDCLSDEDKVHIVELLSCDEKIIENIAAQIVDGWTEAGYHSGITYGPMPHTALDKARRLVAKAAPDLRDKAITRLEEIAVRAQKDASKAFSKQLAAERKAEDYRRRYDAEVAF